MIIILVKQVWNVEARHDVCWFNQRHIYASLNNKTRSTQSTHTQAGRKETIHTRHKHEQNPKATKSKVTQVAALSSIPFGISIFVIHIYACVKLCTYFPPLPSIFMHIYRHMYMYTCFDYCVITPYKQYTPIITSLCVPAATGWSRAHVWMSTPCVAIKLESLEYAMNYIKKHINTN